MDPEALAFEELDDPRNNIPDEGERALMEIWKGDLRLYNDRIKDRMEAAKQAYEVVLGQCSQPVRDRLTASEAWQRIQADTDLMGLLRLIRQSLYTGATRTKDTVSLQEAEEALFHFTQGEHMSNHEYLEKFHDIIKRVEHHGGEPGCHDSRVTPIIQRIATDPMNPTTDETNNARVRARNEYLGSYSSGNQTQNGMDHSLLSYRTITLVGQTNTHRPSQEGMNYLSIIVARGLAEELTDKTEVYLS